jgi:hypothetical protein
MIWQEELQEPQKCDVVMLKKDICFVQDQTGKNKNITSIDSCSFIIDIVIYNNLNSRQCFK